MVSKENLPRGGKIKAIRINLICDCLREGLSYNEIQSRLNNSPDKYFCGLRGECSVANVKRVIDQLPSKKYHISDVIEIPQNSYKDRVEKHDLEITTDNQDVGIIGIQVKSNIYNILEFYQHLNHDPEIAKQIALQDKLIIINGSLEDSIIQRNFLDQLHAIQEYHQGQS